MRKMTAFAAALAALVILALPASAGGAGTVTMTTPFHQITQTFPSANPCSGAPGTLLITYNGVAHVTFLTSGVGAGTGWATFTATGTFVFTPANPTQPSFTGQFTAWDGENLNLKNFAATSILAVNGTGSDGSTLRFHDVMHMTILNPLTSSPTIIVSFDKPTCG